MVSFYRETFVINVSWKTKGTYPKYVIVLKQVFL